MRGRISCEEAKQIDLVDYLDSLGHYPKKIRNTDYWYLSPLREERTPSFKVNRKLNVWYDFGEGRGGNMIDFGMLYHRCSVSELLEKLSGYSKARSLSFHPPSLASASQTEGLASRPSAGEKKEPGGGRIIILNERKIASNSLLEYLEKRRIPVAIAERFCREVDFLLYEKKYTALGFKNDLGGYELRNQHFKGSSSPKSVTFFDHDQNQLAVFEGFFSYLSFLAIYQKKLEMMTERQANYLVLNSLSFLEKSRKLMEDNKQIHLFLDRDKQGMKATEKALNWSVKYNDGSDRYKRFKDLNEFLVNKEEQRKEQSQGRGRHF